MILRAIAVLFATAGFLTAAHADDMDAKKVERFIQSMAEVNAYADKMEAEGRAEFFDEAPNPILTGEFTPYSSGLKLAKEKSPKDYTKISGIVKAHGFTANDWAVTGDRVLAAYLAIEMGKDPEFAGIADMDPSMLDAMPPKAKVQFAGMLKALEKIEAVPAADKEALQENYDAYTAFIEAENR